MKKYINEAVRMQQLAGIRPINEEKEPIKTFFFGYDLDAIQAVQDYVKSKYMVVGHDENGQDQADAVEWTERGDDLPNALDIHNPAMLQDRELLSLIAAAEGGEGVEDGMYEDQAVTDYPEAEPEGVEIAIPADDSTPTLDEYEVIYVRGNDGKCYRVTDEGYRDQVADHYCRR